MHRAAGVVPREFRNGVRNAVVVGKHHATVEGLRGGVEGFIARVDSGCVRVPEGEVDGWDRFAGGRVDDLEVDEKVGSGLVRAEVGLYVRLCKICGC